MLLHHTGNAYVLYYNACGSLADVEVAYGRLKRSMILIEEEAIRTVSLAYIRMSLIWNLHVSLEHMKHEAMVPDLVTYGCVVDAYLDRRLGRNLKFAIKKI